MIGIRVTQSDVVVAFQPLQNSSSATPHSITWGIMISLDYVIISLFSPFAQTLKSVLATHSSYSIERNDFTHQRFMSSQLHTYLGLHAFPVYAGLRTLIRWKLSNPLLSRSTPKHLPMRTKARESEHWRLYYAQSISLLILHRNFSQRHCLKDDISVNRLQKGICQTTKI